MLRYADLIDFRREGQLKVRTKVFIRTSSFFWQKLILLTAMTPWVDNSSHVLSSPTPSKSHDWITPVDEFREECMVPVIVNAQRVFNLSIHFEWPSVKTSTKTIPFLNYFTILSLSAQQPVFELQNVIIVAWLPHCLMQSWSWWWRVVGWVKCGEKVVWGEGGRVRSL